MKKSLFVCFIFYFIANCVFAQDIAQEAGTQYTPEERAGIITDWMRENLLVTDAQRAQIEALNLEYARKLEEVKQISEKTDQTNAARNISEEKDEKLRKILTEDQLKIYLDKKEELRKQAREISRENRKLLKK